MIAFGYYQSLKNIMSLREAVRLKGEADGVIESAGGWAVK
jgi:hypothetical protein